MPKYIPVHEYARKLNAPLKNKRQAVYRWIREKRFKEGDIIIEEITVKRIRIREDAVPVDNLR